MPKPKKKEEKKLPKMPKMITADELAKEEAQVKIIPTNTPIDELIGGGIRENEAIELYGEYGAGKTQVALTLATQVASEPDGHVIFIDCEHTFRARRIKQIAEARGYDPEQVLRNIHVAIPEKVEEQACLLDAVPKEITPKLLIIDGVTTLFRAEYLGRGALYERQPLLGKHLKQIKDYSKNNKVPTILTNQVYASVDGAQFLPLEYRELAVGGHTLYHSIDNRIFIRKASEGKRIAKLVDSSCYPKQERVFQITEKGVEGEVLKEETKQDEA